MCASAILVVLVGTAGYLQSMQAAMSPAPATLAAVVPRSAPRYDPAKPTVAIVLGAPLSEITDVLGPYAIFASSHAYNVYTVASTRTVRTLMGGLDTIPDFSFAGLDALLGHAPDIILVPAIPDIKSQDNVPALDWLKKHADKSILFSWCTGAEVLAAAGLLDGKSATAHWADIDWLERAYPLVRWKRDVRYVDSGTRITSAGLTSGIDATLHLLKRLQGAGLAEETRRAIDYPPSQFIDAPQMQPYAVSVSDAPYVLNATFFWPKWHVGVELTDGVSELGLAALFDVYSASWTTQLETVSPQESVTSLHGMQLAARRHTPISPVVTIPDPAASKFAFEAALEGLAHDDDVLTAAFAAKRLEYRATSLTLTGRALPARPLTGLAGVACLGALCAALAQWCMARRRHC